MPEQSHKNWKRPKGLEWEVAERERGWIAFVKADGIRESLPIYFATEELATKAARAVVDYAVGPISISTTTPKKGDDDEKPKRKAPGKSKKTSASAAG